MGLQFAMCDACGERHALWRGAMSVHMTAGGDRCSGRAGKPAAAFESKSQQASDVRRRAAENAAVREYATHGKKVRRANQALARVARQTAPPVTVVPKQKQNPPGSRMLPRTMAQSVAKAQKNIDKWAGKARGQRKGKLLGLHDRKDPIDRGIYQVKGAYPVSGGLPTLGGRR